MPTYCGQINIPTTDETPLPCEEFTSDRCATHEAALTYLGLPENTTLDVVIETLLLSLIDVRNRTVILEDALVALTDRVVILETP